MSNSNEVPANKGKELGDKLRRLRKVDGLTLRDVSNDTGISLYRLSRLERGHKNARLNLEEFCALAAVYGWDISPPAVGRQDGQPLDQAH